MRNTTLGQWAVRLMVAGTLGLGGVAAAAAPAAAIPVFTAPTVVSTVTPLPATVTVDPPTETKLPGEQPVPLSDVIWA